MASPNIDKEAIAKARIIAHMNKDHSDSLIRYLQHYTGFSLSAARNARLIDITFEDMTIASPTAYHVYTNTIRLNPPLSAWSEARARLVEMDGEARWALGCSDITVKKYIPPSGFMAVVVAVVVWTFATFSRRSNFLPGSYYYSAFFQHVPRFAKLCYMLQPFVLSTIPIHCAEAYYLAKYRLEKHTVPTFSSLWWKWMISDFVEGYGTLHRFDLHVEEERIKKEQQKH